MAHMPLCKNSELLFRGRLCWRADLFALERHSPDSMRGHTCLSATHTHTHTHTHIERETHTHTHTQRHVLLPCVRGRQWEKLETPRPRGKAVQPWMCPDEAIHCAIDPNKNIDPIKKAKREKKTTRLTGKCLDWWDGECGLEARSGSALNTRIRYLAAGPSKIPTYREFSWMGKEGSQSPSIWRAVPRRQASS